MFFRKFIILNKQGSKDVKGHVKLEVRSSKARLSLNIEGVEKDKDGEYKLYIVSNEKNNFTEVLLGKVERDKRARGKLDVGFNSDQVDGDKLDISNFNILILKRVDNINEQSEIILAGYIHKDDDSLSKVKNRKRVKSKETLDKVNIVDKKEQEHQDNTSDTKALEKEEHPTKELLIKEIQDEDNINISPKEDSTEIKKLGHYSKQIASYTRDILKVFKKVNPFKIEFEDYKWWQIDYEAMNSHRGFLPYYSYILNNEDQNKPSKYASCQIQIEKYNHYLFGIVEKQEEVTHYVYAIPGKYERKEHPYGGNTGFVTWLEDKTGNGYWLSYIDARTGNVVRPR